MEIDGFNLLFLIIADGSPQLGGHARDLQVYVNGLTMIDGESVANFSERTQKILCEIEFQKDKTGQHNRLLYRFVLLLSSLFDFKEILHPIMRQFMIFFHI